MTRRTICLLVLFMLPILATSRPQQGSREQEVAKAQNDLRQAEEAYGYWSRLTSDPAIILMPYPWGRPEEIQHLFPVSKQQLEEGIMRSQWLGEGDHLPEGHLSKDLSEILAESTALKQQMEKKLLPHLRSDIENRRRRLQSLLRVATPPAKTAPPPVRTAAPAADLITEAVHQVAGEWRFGRIGSDRKKEFLCRLTLTMEKREKGYRLAACHPNESYWDLEDATTIVFMNLEGNVTSRLTMQTDKYWEGKYYPRPGEKIVGELRNHYIER